MFIGSFAFLGLMEDRLFTPAVVTLILLSFVMGTSEFIVMGILPDISDGLGVRYSLVGGLVSVFALSYAVCTPLITAVTGRFGRFRILLILMCVFLLSDVLTLVSWDYWSLALSRVVTAASSGSLLAVGMTFVMDLVTPRYRAKAVSWIFAGFSISSVIGVPLGTAMSHLLGWRSVFVLILVMGLGAALLALRTLPRLGAPEARGGIGGAGRMLRDPRVLLGACVTVFGAMGMYVIYTYITPILEEEIGFPEAYVSVGLMAMGIVMLVSNLVSGKIASEKGGLRTVRLTYLAEAALMFLLPTAVASAVLGMADLLIMGLFMYLFNSSVQMHLMEIANRDYPEAITLASSLNPTSFNIGITFASLLGGVIYDTVGINYLGYAGCACILVASVMTFAVCRLCRAEGRGTSVT